MVSKILFIVLIGCAVAFASPVADDVVNPRSQASEDLAEALKILFERVFGELFKKIAEQVVGPLHEAFQKIKDRLNTEEFKQAFEELQQVLAKVVDENGEINVADEEDKKVIQEEVTKVENALGEVLHQALNQDEKVDASEFKKAVEQFKNVVDDILAKQQ